MGWVEPIYVKLKEVEKLIVKRVKYDLGVLSKIDDIYQAAITRSKLRYCVHEIVFYSLFTYMTENACGV